MLWEKKLKGDFFPQNPFCFFGAGKILLVLHDLPDIISAFQSIRWSYWAGSYFLRFFLERFLKGE